MVPLPQKILVFCVTLLAFTLRIAFIESRTATIDEVSSLKWMAEKSIWDLITTYHTNSHQLISILAYFVDNTVASWGDHWLTLYRAPSLIFGVLTIPLIYQLGKRLLGDEVGLWGALLLAVAPYHIDFSLQMRGYATMTFWAIVVYWCAWQGIISARSRKRAIHRQSSLWYWVGLALASILVIYAHLFGALAVGATWCIIIVTAFWQKAISTWLKRAGISLMLTSLGIASLYGPIFLRIVNTPHVEHRWNTQIEPIWTDNQLNVAALDDYLKVLRLYGPLGEPRSWLVYSFVILAGVGLIAVFLKPTRSTDEPRYRIGLYFALWLFAPFAVTMFGLQFIDGFYVFRRFFMFFQPLYLLLMAQGIVAVGWVCGWIGHRFTGYASEVRQGVTLALIVVALSAAAWKLNDQLGEDTDNQWYRVAQTISVHGTNPLVICEPQGQRMREKAVHEDECMRNLEFYFQPQLASDIPWLHQEIDKVATIPFVAAHPALEQQVGDAWLVLWQHEWPTAWLQLHQSPSVVGLRYYSIGTTLLIQTEVKPAQLLALADLTDAVIHLKTTPQDHFSYYMSQAQMKALVGDRETATKAWLAARDLSPEGIDAPGRLQAVATLIGLADLLSPHDE